MNSTQDNQYAKAGGRVLWLTGLSGAGKSTIANALKKQFDEQHINVLVLDGDIVRKAIDDPHWKFDLDSRLRGSYRYAKLAAMGAEQGLTVIVPTISMFHEVQEWNRENIIGYFEVYLKSTSTTREARDPKNLYQNSLKKENKQMIGLDLPCEVPITPDLTIENNGTRDDLPAITRQIMTQFVQTYPNS